MRSLTILLLFAALGIGFVTWTLLRGSAQDAVVTQKPRSASIAQSDPSQLSQVGGPVEGVGKSKLEGPVVQGVVLGPEGNPVDGAKVALSKVVGVGPEAQDQELETIQVGSDGRFRFRTPLQYGLTLAVEAPPAPIGQRARHDRRGDLAIFGIRPMPASTRVEVSPRVREQVVRLEHGFTVHGFLREQSGGTTLSDVKVEIALGQFGSEGVRSVRTDASGRFRFEGVPSGVVGLCAHDPRYAPAIVPAVTVGAPKPSWLAFRESGRTLHGKIVGAGGATPVAGARVTAHALGLQQIVVSEAISDGGGEYKLSGLGAGRYLVIVRHEEWSTQKQVMVVGGDTPTPPFELAPRVEIDGRLTGTIPSQGVPLLLSSESGELMRTRSGPDGRFRFARKASVGAAILTIEDDLHYFSVGGKETMGVQVEERSTSSREFAIARGGRLAGRVLDSEGKPVAGARILSERRVLWIMGTQRPIAECDADGRFSITGTPPGALTLIAAKAGFAKRTIEVSGPDQGEDKTLEPITLERAGTIFGTVTRNGLPCAGAQVLIGKGEVLTVAGLDGRFELRDVPAGVHELLTRYSTASKQRVGSSLEVAPGQRLGPIDFEIPGGRLIRGEVVDLEGSPVTDALIGIDGDFSETVFTNPDGTFDLEIPGGMVTLSAMTADGQSIGFEDVQPRAREKVRIVVPLPPQVVLTAKVLALPERKVVSVGILRVEPVDSGFELPGISKILRSKRSILPRQVSMPSGSLRLERFPVGKMRLLLHCQGYAPYEKIIEAKAREPVDLKTILLEPGARVTGRVVDRQGKPISGARVLVGEESDLAFRRIANGGVMTDASGVFAVTGISQHSRRIVVSAPGYATRAIELSLPRDLLRKDPLVVELGKGAAVRVKLVDPDGAPVPKGAVLMLRDDMYVEEALVDERGIATFPHREPGAYSVAYFTKEGQRVPIDVAEEGQAYEVTIVRKVRK